MRHAVILVFVLACGSATPTPGSLGTTAPPVDTSNVGLRPAPGAISSTTVEVSRPTIAVQTTLSLLDEWGRPRWLGTVVLPVGEDGFGIVEPTPPELIGRAFGTPDLLPAPTSAEFQATTSDVPPLVAARSTWSPECPTALEDLTYVLVSHIGFDGLAHTGELIVNRSVADDVVDVFERLYEIRYPIEEMRVVTREEFDLPPTGDGNNTTAFVCRPATGSTAWSQHAYGLAIDINPFQNPYVKGEVVLPELSSYYIDRSGNSVGLIRPDDEVVGAFNKVGWAWGGEWSTLKDWMHFSLYGR